MIDLMRDGSGPTVASEFPSIEPKSGQDRMTLLVVVQDRHPWLVHTHVLAAASPIHCNLFSAISF